jgi:glycosyltransferase involved in cell wall biosynthesis
LEGSVVDPRPVALVTREVSPYRREPFELLDEAQGVEVLAWKDGDPTQVGAARRVAAGRYRAVVCGIAGRAALPATYAAARRAGVPFVLWTSLWAHPRSPVHLVSRLPTRALYRSADAVVAYGRHVARYVEREGGRADVFVAPQACEHREPADPAAAAAWRARLGAGPDAFVAVFAGRLVRDKGIDVLADAWRASRLAEDGGILAVAGAGPAPPAGRGVRGLGWVDDLAPLHAAADVLVLPSARTATFLEPWGLVVNEAMHQGTPVIASDAVGAVAGGLVRDGRNGLVVPAGDADALAARLRALAANPQLRAALGAAAREDVAPYTPAAWADGVSAALASVHASRRPPG